MLTANDLLKLLTDTLTDDAASRSGIQTDYRKFRSKMTDSDARLFASVSFLRRFIADSLESE